MCDEHVRAQPGPPTAASKGLPWVVRGCPLHPLPNELPSPLGGGPSALPQSGGGTPCVCLCFAAHSQPWARSHTAWHPWVRFCTPTHTCAHSHTALHTCAHTCACSCTALHALTRLPCCHSLAHLCTLSHTRTCSCTPVHTLSRALHTCAPSPTAWHTCTHTCTPVHVLVHFCMLFHNPAHSFTPLMLSQPCTPVHFTPCAHSHPPVHTLTPLCPLAQPRCCCTHPARRSLLVFSHVPRALAQPWAPLHAPHVLARSHPALPGGHSSWGSPVASHPSLGVPSVSPTAGLG